MCSYLRKPGRRAALALVGLLGLVATAGADECEQLPLPSVTLQRLSAPVDLDTHYGYREITHLSAELARPDSRVLGLTRGQAKVRIDLRIASYGEPSGRWECASPQLVIDYGYQPMTVYIAREFPVGSCAYEQIYQHELRHVQTYQQHLASIEQELLSTLRSRFATGAPWRGPRGQTRQVLQRELEDRWLPYISKEMEKVESAQAQIDSPEEYARVAASCGGEIRRIVH